MIGDEEVWPFGQVLAIEAQIELHAKHNHQPTNQSNHNAHQATYSLGQLVEIDAIEAKLPLNPTFINDLKLTINSTDKSKYIPIDDIIKHIHV